MRYQNIWNFMHQSLWYETPRSVHFNQEKKKIEIIEIPMGMWISLATYPHTHRHNHYNKFIFKGF